MERESHQSSPRVPPRPAGRPKPAPRSGQSMSRSESPGYDGDVVQPAPPSQMLAQPGYSQDVYMSTAWVPLRRDPKNSNRPVSSDSTKLKRQSGLNQLVIERRGSKAYEEDPEQKELDRKLAARIANSIYYHACARCCDLAFVIVIIVVIAIIIFLGVFFWFYFN